MTNKAKNSHVARFLTDCLHCQTQKVGTNELPCRDNNSMSWVCKSYCWHQIKLIFGLNGNNSWHFWKKINKAEAIFAIYRMNEEKVYSVSVTLPRWENFPRTIYKKGEAMILCQAYWFLIILSTLKKSQICLSGNKSHWDIPRCTLTTNKISKIRSTLLTRAKWK